MTTLATRELEQYIATQTANRGSVAFDEIIFANIPNLTAQNLANNLRMPANSHIVHRQAISQSGIVNENAVVYSVTMGTEIGDFDFNFIGLVNRSRNLLAVAVYTNTIKKVKNKNGIQGNSITRSILLEFTGAKNLTNINISAETWQIDFTARLKGLDEKIRLTNRDLYGRAIFFENGFKITRGSGNQYYVEIGSGYVEGVRLENKNRQTLTVRSLPCSIYVDLVHHNTVTGAYQTDIQFLQVSKNDWVDTANYQHYVQILADIDRNGVVTDRRLLSPFLSIQPKDLDENSQSEKDYTGHSHRLPLASLIKKGIVKLYSGIDSDSEEMSATPKAIKRLKDLIDTNSRNFNNFITNSKKSNAINSTSSDNVATSYAVKQAYDKGVEAYNKGIEAYNKGVDAKNTADNAQRTATEANNNANGRVSKAGDTMTGILEIDLNASFVRGKQGGTNKWYVGKGSHSTDDITLHSYAYNYGFILKSDRAELAKPLHIGNHRVPHYGDAYIQTTTSQYGGLTIERPSRNDKMMLESNDNKFAFIRRNRTSGSNIYIVTLPEKNGTALLDTDFSYQKIGTFEVRKYPDGTMIQTYMFEMNDLFTGNEKSFNWAISFSQTPMIMGQITTSVGWDHDCGVNILTKSNASKVHYYFYEHGNPNQGLCRVQFMAIGRWK